MFKGAIAAALILLSRQQQPEAPAAAPSALTLALSTDKPEYVIGDNLQAEVALTNTGEASPEVAELTFEERSVSFDVTIEATPGKTKQFLYSVVRPEPHLVDRVAPARVTLRPKKSLTALFRIPVLKTGPVTVIAVYKGAEKEVRSTPVKVNVAPRADGSSRLAASVDTSKGNFQIHLLPEEAPNNVASFVSLVNRGFYNNMNFHRVIRNGWVQTGCPYDNGFGHPGYGVRSEAQGQTATHEPGTVALSQNLKGGFTGSQFFISLSRQQSFDQKFTVIGRVPESSLNVVKEIGQVDTDKNTDRPVKEDVRLKEIKIIVVK